MRLLANPRIVTVLWQIGSLAFIGLVAGLAYASYHPAVCSSLASGSFKICYPNSQALTVNPDTGTVTIGSLLTLDSPILSDHAMASMQHDAAATAPALPEAGFTKRALGSTTYYFLSDANAVGPDTVTALFAVHDQYVTISYPAKNTKQAEKALASLTVTP